MREPPIARVTWLDRSFRILLALGFVVIVAAIGMAATTTGRQWLHAFDAVVLGERLMDTLARMRSDEDWSNAEVLGPAQDYSWLQAGGVPVRIAHALGESGRPTANSLAAAQRTYANGFRLFEVDLVEESGELRCKHDPGPQSGGANDGCTFESLLAVLPDDTWLVLDIKTEFHETGQRIVDRVKGTAGARRIVFQLYRPEDVARFNRWQTEALLPGPLLTAYRAPRRMDYIAEQAVRIGVRALTLPLTRLPALTYRPVGVAILVHPVHDCNSWTEALRDADGIYMQSSLRCEAPISKSTP